MNHRLEKIRRHGAMVIAAINGENELHKVAATFGTVDPQEILVAKYEADRLIKIAEQDALKRLGPLFDDLRKLDNSINGIKLADHNRRGTSNIFDPARKQKAATDLGAAAIDATLRHRDEI